MWRVASYTGELCEPFPTNPRNVTFPLTRRRTRQSGSLAAAAIEFTRADGANPQYTDRMLDANDVTIDSGTADAAAWLRPQTTIDLRPSGGGPAHLGVYDVVSETMRLALGEPGAARPADLFAASVYMMVR